MVSLFGVAKKVLFENDLKDRKTRHSTQIQEKYFLLLYVSSCGRCTAIKNIV